MSGYIKLHRGWRDNTIFRGEFSRADAWVWMIENACWKPERVRVKGAAITLERGELSFSQRFLAEKWGWSKSRVDRFIADLRQECMIETRSKIGASANHNAGQGQCIIKLCNYTKYQDQDGLERGNVEPVSGATAGQQRGKEEESKKERKKYTTAFAVPDWVPATEWAAYEDMRKSIKRPMTDRAKELAVIELAKLSDDGHRPGDVLNQSVLNSWQGLFPVKADQRKMPVC